MYIAEWQMVGFSITANTSFLKANTNRRKWKQFVGVGHGLHGGDKCIKRNQEFESAKKNGRNLCHLNKIYRRLIDYSDGEWVRQRELRIGMGVN